MKIIRWCMAIMLITLYPGCNNNNGFEEKVTEIIESYNKSNSYEERINSIMELADLIVNDSESMDYPFDELSSVFPQIDFLNSEDGNLRIFSWGEEHNLNHSTPYSSIIQYRYKNKVYSYSTNGSESYEPYSDRREWSFFTESDWWGPTAVMSYNISDSTAYNPILNELGYMRHKKLYTITNNKGKTIYLLKSRIGGTYFYHTLSIEEGELRPYSGFRTTNGLMVSIRCIDKAIYYPDTKQFFAPLEDEYDMVTDRYDKYHFNGLVFELFDENVAYPGLNTELERYASLKTMFITEKYIIRVDMTSIDEYRYASWSRESDISKKPDLIIEDGKYDEKSGAYVFNNEGYTYFVREDPSFTDDALIVKKGNTIMIKQERDFDEEYDFPE